MSAGYFLESFETDDDFEGINVSILVLSTSDHGLTYTYEPIPGSPFLDIEVGLVDWENYN